MNDKQEAALRSLCERYHVTFDPADYQPQFDLPDGYVAGWVGGPIHAALAYYGTSPSTHRSTIYVGVDLDGNVSS